MTRGTICSVVIATGVLTGPVAADILLFDLEDPQQSADFFAAVETMTVLASYDFDSLPDLGLIGFSGPLTSAGSGPIPPGFIPDGITLDSNLEPWGDGGPATRGPGANGLAGVGPSAQFGVASNSVVANWYVDSFDIIFTARDGSNMDRVRALVFTGVSIIGLDRMDITVYDSAEEVIGFFPYNPAPHAGHTYGILGVGTNISRVNVYDFPEHDVYGAEGIMGEMTVWGVSARCPADLDGDGIVGASDLLSLLVSWGPCKGCPADFNDDGSVGASDLLALLVNWGPCP